MAASQFTVGLDLSALNVGFKEHALRGIGRYVSELKSYLDRTRSSSSSAIGINYFDYFELANKGAGARFVDRLPLGKLTLKQQLLYPIAFNRLDCDTLHFPAHMDAPAWGMKNYALTVLDLIPFVLSDLYRAEQPNWRFHFARWLEVRAIKNASLIMAISDNTAHDLHRVLGLSLIHI